MVLSGSSHFLEQVHLLEAPGQPPRRCDALIEAGALAATGEYARKRAEVLGLPGLDARGWWLGPALVDPHSVLEQPQGGRAETLQSLARSAAAAGYGTVAVLPQAHPWRDRAEAAEAHAVMLRGQHATMATRLREVRGDVTAGQAAVAADAEHWRALVADGCLDGCPRFGGAK